MIETAVRLEALLESEPPRLAAISETEAERRPSSEGWSRKQLLGHLIDSAGNNHQRIVRAQLAPSLEFPNYQQEGWVACQSYETASWQHLIQLWLALNRHLAHVIRAMPEDALSHPVSIGGKPPIPLSEVVSGYLEHLEHHLGQI